MHFVARHCLSESAWNLDTIFSRNIKMGNNFWAFKRCQIVITVAACAQLCSFEDNLSDLLASEHQFWSIFMSFNALVRNFFQTMVHKEYTHISVIEGTASSIVLQRFDSPNLSPLCLQYTARPVRLPEQAGRGWVSQIFVWQWRVLSLQSLIYILWWYITKRAYHDSASTVASN